MKNPMGWEVGDLLVGEDRVCLITGVFHATWEAHQRFPRVPGDDWRVCVEWVSQHKGRPEYWMDILAMNYKKAA